jgi:hypothetical protein
MQACLDQALRPLNKRVFGNLVDAANRFLGLALDPAFLIAEAEAAGQTYFEYWATVLSNREAPFAKDIGRLGGSTFVPLRALRDTSVS